MSQPAHGVWPGSCPWRPPGSQPGSTALGILQNQFPGLAAVRLPRPALRGKDACSQGGHHGAWGGTAEVCGAGAGLVAGGWPVRAGPALGTEGPLLLGPARPGPREFREVSRRGQPQVLAWPASGRGCVTGDGRRGWHPQLRDTDGGGWGAGRAAPWEEQTGAVHTLLARRTVLAVVTHLRPEEGSWTWESESPGFQSWLCGCVTWGR